MMLMVDTLVAYGIGLLLSLNKKAEALTTPSLKAIKIVESIVMRLNGKLGSKLVLKNSCCSIS